MVLRAGWGMYFGVGKLNSLFALAWFFNKGSQTKIPNLDIHVAIEEQISELEIAMDDLVGVHIVAGANDLDEEKTCFGLGVSFSAAEHVHHAPILAKLERHVDVVIVFKTFLKTNDIGMLEGAMELDFCV